MPPRRRPGANPVVTGSATTGSVSGSPPTTSRMEAIVAKGSADQRNDQIVSLSKRRGFVYPSSEIYGGTRSAWDYGPLGVELKENVRRQWWRTMGQGPEDIAGLDSAVILSPRG